MHLANCSKEVKNVKAISCYAFPGTKKKYLIWVKNGMAKKAMINNMKTGNMKKLNKQIEKGTVLIYQQ